MLAKEIKTGMVVVYQGSPVLIETISVSTPSARGASTMYKFRARNVVSRQKVDITLKGTDSLEPADFQKRPVGVMYRDATHMHLIDQDNYQQYSIPLDDIDDQQPYIKDEMQGLIALIYNDDCVGLQLPTAIELQVIECDPGVKGNSATSRTKPAKTETGLIVQVPEYLKQGERIKVDTRTGQFLSRA